MRREVDGRANAGTRRSSQVAQLPGMRFATDRQAKDAVIDWLHFYDHQRPQAMVRSLSLLTFASNQLAEQERLAG